MRYRDVLAGLILGVGLGVGVPLSAQDFRRGDADGGGRVTVADAAFLSYSLGVVSTPSPPCEDAADANDDGFLDLQDVVFILSTVGVDVSVAGPTLPPPPDPGPDDCGLDPTPDGLSCDAYDSCDGPVVPAPDPDHVLWVTDSIAELGDSVTVVIYYDNLGDDGAAALSFGLTHDESKLSLVLAQLYSHSSLDPVHATIGYEPGGWTGSIFTSYLGSYELEPDTFRPIFTATYEVIAEGSSSLDFTSELGSPAVDVVVNVGTELEPVTPGIESGTVTVATFQRGDANGDGLVTIADPIFVLNYLLVPGSPPVNCPDAGDMNDDGSLNIADTIAGLSFLFLGGDPFPEPLDCGIDPTPDGQACWESPCF